MRQLKNLIFAFSILTLLTVGCNTNQSKKIKIETDQNGVAILSDSIIENLVRRSYQYIALYNVNNKFAMTQGGWNTIMRDTSAKDHTMTDIARPNNDSYYTSIMADLRMEPIIISMPAFNSDYVSLMVTAYDHYVNIPKSTRLGDFSKPEKLLLYSDRTEGYEGEPIEGVDVIFKTSGDFVSAIFRITPHINEPKRYQAILKGISELNFQSLSEFQGKEPKKGNTVKFPKIGKTDADIFEYNFLEVMQFIMNHVDFDPNNEMDQNVLIAFKPLGIEPGKKFDPQTALKLDGKKFREIADKLKDENLALMKDLKKVQKLVPMMFQPKGKTTLEAILNVSIVGPIGVPMEEAVYPPVNSNDGLTLNAMNDYIIKMSKDELPPSNAFWSLTLYDNKNGFFIPNEHYKYSVGKNAGYKLNEQGGIEIYVAVEKPEGVPEENWLPINRQDQDLDIILRNYVPDLGKLKDWKTPVAVKIENE
ncbi:DUF1214 domain-containing protein [Flammeovirga sp. OC4]|uniref:DUF1214 domain-containing protein n=1 Tax=Flammeovirga sp. OC4 TaxID=1382345 RepID=UPI0005C75254|nr:DUF1214 domain-containing protein [Flammeovirga sp. OC4]